MSDIYLAAVAERDKRRTAAHEAGHLTARLSQGIDAHAQIWPTGTHSPKSEHTWGGRVQGIPFRVTPENWKRLIAGESITVAADLISPEESAVFGIAGVAGEFFANNPNAFGHEIDDFLEYEMESLSESDKANIGEGADIELLADKALEILRANKSFFQWAVAELLQHEFIESEAARKKFEAFQKDAA